MKRLLFASIIAAMAFTACDNNIDNWYSETFDYSGRFVIAAECDEYADDNSTYHDAIEAMIYNTAANTANEIWLETEVAGTHIKSRLSISGNSSSFKAAEAANTAKPGTIYIDTDYGLAPFSSAYAAYFRVPTAAGQSNDGIELYTRVTLEEGKIVPKGAITPGGNTSDSVYLRLTLHHDLVKFVSYELPAADWEDPAVPEYGWRLQANSNSNAADADYDEHWTVAGFRYTGFPEDR
ncbi:MAG: hypothetical protein LBD28_06835 [Tannerellaceae bacterium]|jgi:hypothetical protein|nr:hypothetical protein [Tannerellaceae bacterium]